MVAVVSLGICLFVCFVVWHAGDFAVLCSFLG